MAPRRKKAPAGAIVNAIPDHDVKDQTPAENKAHEAHQKAIQASNDSVLAKAVATADNANQIASGLESAARSLMAKAEEARKEAEKAQATAEELGAPKAAQPLKPVSLFEANQEYFGIEKQMAEEGEARARTITEAVNSSLGLRPSGRTETRRVRKALRADTGAVQDGQVQEDNS